jgi:anti-anti-sigma factor
MAGLPVEDRNGVGVARVSGRLTIGRELAALRDGLAGVLDAGFLRIVLDLDAVPYIDSAGVGELVACRRTVREQGGRLVLARPRGKVRDLLELTRIETLVPVYDALDAAVDALAPDE